MKRIFVTAITLVVIMFSSTVFACSAFISLSKGTWTSSSGDIRTRTWELITYGNSGVLDSRSDPVTGPGQGYSWVFPESVVNNISWTGFTQISSSEYSRSVSGSFSSDKYPFAFNFTGGNNYSITNASGSFTIKMLYDSSHNYLQTIDSSYMFKGIVDQVPNLMMTITSKPDVAGLIGPFIVGTFDNITWDINPVPIPASLWIFGSGLLGLIGLRRRIS
jgi:hypothetical protein